MNEIPIRKIQGQQKPKSTFSRKLLITAIFILIILNGAVVYFIYHKAQVMAESASSASSSAKTFSGFGQGADLPASDVAGEDPLGLDRYKGAVRTDYSKGQNVTTIEYQTKDSSLAVLAFYKIQLASNNWILEEAKTQSITFSKEKNLITISTKEDKDKKITIFTIEY